jgi:hypothetical protein
VTPTSPPPTPAPSSPSGTTLPTAPSAADPTSVAPASADPADAAADPGGSLPIWVVPVVLGLLVLTGVGVLLQRRRHRPGP